MQSCVTDTTHSKIICFCYCSNPVESSFHNPGHISVSEQSICHGLLEIKVEADLSHPIPGILGKRVTVTIEHPQDGIEKRKSCEAIRGTGQAMMGRTIDADVQNAFGLDSGLKMPVTLL